MPPTPLRFAYEAPTNGLVTVALFNAQGAPLRHIVCAQPRNAGQVVEAWDGLDDAGRPLTAGTYRWQALLHDPLKVVHKLSVHNAGKPPFPTADGTGRALAVRKILSAPSVSPTTNLLPSGLNATSV